ncbi:MULTISPECIES: hypothetical protein [Dermabacter]|uniref:Uncharacterized protein n=2 Tax=Dermabacter TaxID=36739 RepID=A0ABX6A4B7_9MICO|nr:MULTISPECIES: hypothetical protein [Dermabacter]SHV77659.1 Uncharacterised protein [Mycobacteroides abscessus subsp. abscessus]ATH96698.1 hypothetical protein COP05_06050 [Dermabacter jinjuensis]EPH14235.1 hypothetical protein HMPREF1484_01532 [Dermabacter sp. HFH0086]MCT1806872.1 hypothetical protein [Dermabacter hominis]MDU2058759.1 hypothetical protein [Dermabacter sp.]
MTVFSGEFSVGGGAWQPIDGTVQVRSEPKWMYSDLRQARLVGDEEPTEYLGIPQRGKETLGPLNPDAEKKTLTKPRKKN